MEYNGSRGEFVDLPKDEPSSNDPGFCMNCARIKAVEARAFPQFYQGGFKLHGASYHPYDFLQFKTGDITCGFGQIISLGQEVLDRRDPHVKVRLLGRISDVAGKPHGVLKDGVSHFLL
jgi:hypothetical protein